MTEEDPRLAGYSISEDKTLLDVDFVHEYLSQNAHWAVGIPYEVVERSIMNSLCFGVYHPRLGQVGFARVITDYATFGYLCESSSAWCDSIRTFKG
jgi:hypothetical protein